MTYVIDKLEKKGLIVRRTCDNDRRIIYAELTETGKNKMMEILPNHYQALAESVDSLTSAEKEIMIEMLKKISFSSKK